MNRFRFQKSSCRLTGLPCQCGMTMLEFVVVLTLVLGCIKLVVPNLRTFRSRSANISAQSTYQTIRDIIPASLEFDQPAVLFSQSGAASIPYPPLSSIAIPANVKLNYFINLPRRDAPSVLSFEVESIKGDRYFRYTAIDGRVLEQIVRKES